MLDSLNDAEQAIEENFGNTLKLSIGETFVEVDEDFIQDSFNLYGIKQLIPRYDDALDMILSSDIPDSDDLTTQK